MLRFNQILAWRKVLSAKINSVFYWTIEVFRKLADTRELIITDSNFDAQPLDAVSKRILSRYLMRIKSCYSGDYGFTLNDKHETTTLGRN
jgi:hypothetical protein